MIPRLREVTPTLFRGGAPTIKDLVWLKDALGIRKIVSLDHNVGEKIDRACKLLGFKHIKVYMHGDRASLVAALHHNLKKLLMEDGPTFVHCLHGKDRTGLIIALFKCKYLGMKPEKAIQEAKSLGFGLGVDPKITSLYEKLIRNCKPEKDNSFNDDIVSNEREYKGDNRDSFLDEGHQGSFAPYLDHTKQAPYDAVYDYINDQSPTRENYQSYKSTNKQDLKDKENIPQIGLYNNDAGISGAGPLFPSGGFISD